MSQFIDLHLHTNCSDGLLGPGELLELVRHKDLVAFSVTDHDTLEGYYAVRELLEDSDPECLPGVELSVDVNSQDLHLLAYLFDPDDNALTSALVEFQTRRNQRGRMMVEKLREMGKDVSFEAVEEAASGGVIGRPHVADALFRLGLVKTYEEAFYKYIGNGRPAFVAKSRLKPEDAIGLVHRAGGVTVMAHPYTADMYRHIEMMVSLGLDGLEIYHYSHSLQDVQQLKHLADRFGLVQTGGSDYHGRESREGEIGSQEVPVELLTVLKERANQIRGQH